MALGSTQSLTEMSTRDISWGRGCRYVGLTILTTSCANCLEAGSLKLLEPSGPETGLHMYNSLRIMACFIPHRLKTPFMKVKIQPKTSEHLMLQQLLQSHFYNDKPKYIRKYFVGILGNSFRKWLHPTVDILKEQFVITPVKILCYFSYFSGYN
jgi:hypothetical protein